MKRSLALPASKNQPVTFCCPQSQSWQHSTLVRSRRSYVQHKVLTDRLGRRIACLHVDMSPVCSIATGRCEC